VVKRKNCQLYYRIYLRNLIDILNHSWGGAVYFAVDEENSIINDKSDELINLYKLIKSGNDNFFKKIDELYYN